MPKIKTTTTTQPVAPRAEGASLKLSANTASHNQMLIPNASGKTALIPTEGTPFTWAFWFKSDKASSSFTRCLLTCRDNGGTFKVKISYNTQLEIEFKDSSGNSRRWITTNFSKTQEDDAWHHLAFVWSGESTEIDTSSTGIQVYLDAVSVARTGGVFGGSMNNLADLSTGSMIFFGDVTTDTGTSTNPRDYHVDEMAWFNTAFTSLEIIELYNSRKTFNPITRHSKKANLKGYWTFDTDKVTLGATSTQVKDSSGNGYQLENSFSGTDKTPDPFTSEDPFPFLNDKVTTIVKKYFSGIVSRNNRNKLREMDSRLGMYPTMARTGDKDRKGNLATKLFDDTETIAFNNNVQNVMYGSLAISGSSKSLQPYTANNNPNNGLSGTGRIIAGISDNTRMTDYKELSSRKNDTENLSFFDDSRINLPGTGSFFMTGTLESDYSGFSSRLHDKTQIVIDMSANTPTKVGMINRAQNSSANSYTSDTVDTKQPLMAYYSPVLKRWQTLGNPFSTNQHHQDALGREYILKHMQLGFCGLPTKNQIATGSDRDTQILHPDRLLNASGRPVSTCGFPFSGNYHATGSQIIKMSDYISAPFLVEKVQFNFNAELESGNSGLYLAYGQRNSGSPSSPSTLGYSSGATKDLMHFRYHNFFILRQFKSKFEQSWRVKIGEDPASPSVSEALSTVTSSIPGLYNLTSGSGVSTYVEDEREMITYSQLVEFSLTSDPIRGGQSSNPQQFMTLDQVRNSALLKGRDALLDRGDSETFMVDDDTPNSFTGSFTINSPVRHSAKLLAAGGPTILGPLGNLFLDNEFTSRGRDRLDKSARALLNGHPSLVPAKSILVGARLASALPYSQETVEKESYDKHSPYILFPEDEIVIGYQFPTPYNPNHGGGPVQEGVATHHIEFNGAGSLVLFGSQIKANKEFHDTLNQPLTSEAVHEAIHYDNPVVDQFLVASRAEYSGSYLDNFATGSVGAGVRSLVGSAENVLSGSFQRFVKCNNIKDRYYDTLVPSVGEMFSIDGHPPENSLGSHRVDRFATYYAGAKPSFISVGIGESYNQKWNYLFPFEKRFASLERSVKDSVYIEVMDIISGSHNGTIISTIQPVVVSNNALSPGAGTGFRLHNNTDTYKHILWGFGSGGRGLFNQVGTNTGQYGGFNLERQRGWKYGIWNGFKETTCVIYRPDRFTGQYADIIQQQYDTRFFDEKTNTLSDSPVKIKFVLPDDEKEVYLVLDASEATANTFESSNISIYATSSLPYFDDGTSPRNRTYNNLANRVIEIEV